jgi:hypothetical protein
MSDPDDQAHPPAIRRVAVGPSHLNLDGAALSGREGPTAQSTALLLAGQSFLDASRDPHLSLQLRGQLEEEGLRLIQSALNTKRG